MKKQPRKNLPQAEKVRTAKVIPGLGTKCAKQQNGGAVIPVGKNYPTRFVEGCDK